MFLLCLSQIIGQVSGVIFVDLSRYFIEPCDEGMLYPVDQKLSTQNQKTVWSQRPKTLCKAKKVVNKVNFDFLKSLKQQKLFTPSE